MSTPRIERVDAHKLDVKRFYMPYDIHITCPGCGREKVRDSSQYLTNPTPGEVVSVDFYCGYEPEDLDVDDPRWDELACDHEWSIDMVMDITLVFASAKEGLEMETTSVSQLEKFRRARERQKGGDALGLLHDPEGSLVAADTAARRFLREQTREALEAWRAVIEEIVTQGTESYNSSQMLHLQSHTLSVNAVDERPV